MPKMPGKSYAEMKALIARNHGIPYAFSWELLIAIAWEESFFNNKEQEGGTAWGFGQVEPSEFYKFETEGAKKQGYYVANLPPRTKVGNATRLVGTLTDDQSVQVMSAALRHYYFDKDRSKIRALYAYGGVYYDGPSSLTKAERIAIIQGWLDCEKHLQFFHQGYDPEEIIKGLHMARNFKNVEAQYRKVLFPLGDDYLIQWLKKYISQVNANNQLLKMGMSSPSVEAAQALLNHKGASQLPDLVKDGVFGQKTLARVHEFQRANLLIADGIVGPKTKARLTV